MLFEPELPEGFSYCDDFLTLDEEAELAAHFGAIQFDTFAMRGVVAKRRVAFYGMSYGDGPVRPMPQFLNPYRDRAAAWAGLEADAFVMALVNEYTPGAPIGWHRDAPQYGIVAGLSLLSACRMKLRPYVSPRDLADAPSRPPRKTTHEITLEPRSGYVMTGKARNEYEHSIPAVDALRYSVTFRTLR